MMMAMLSMPCLHAALVLPAQPHVGRRSAVFGAAAATVWQFAPAPAEAATGVAKEWTLANGVKMPTLALNTAGLSADDSERAFTEAVAVGFTHVDFHPGIERDGVARALKSGGVDRAKVFLNTKIRKPPVGTSPSDAAKLVFSQLDEDLAVLGVPQVDMLMLRDSPDPAVMQAQWAAMERCSPRSALGRRGDRTANRRSSASSPPKTAGAQLIMQHVGMGKDTNGLVPLVSREASNLMYGALGAGAVGRTSEQPDAEADWSKHVPSRRWRSIWAAERLRGQHPPDGRSALQVHSARRLPWGFARVSLRLEPHGGGDGGAERTHESRRQPDPLLDHGVPRFVLCDHAGEEVRRSLKASWGTRIMWSGPMQCNRMVKLSSVSPLSCAAPISNNARSAGGRIGCMIG